MIIFNFFFFGISHVTFAWSSLGVHGKNLSCFECDVEVRGAGMKILVLQIYAYEMN